MIGINRKTGIAAAAVWLFAVFLGLWFAGVLSFSGKRMPEAEESAVAAGQNEEQARVWEIVFRGMKFTIPQKGIALVHESGCLNIRQTDSYLIQISIEDDTIDDIWESMDTRRESLIESGYRMEKEAERLTEGGQDRIRYVVSMEKERGSDYDRSYFEVVLAPAMAGRHILAVIRYDGIDVEGLDEETRDQVYAEGFAAAEAILDRACSTDEIDDEAGSYWMEDVSLDPEQPYPAEDTITYGDGQYMLTVRLPEGCMLVSDTIAGKEYFDSVNQVYVYANVIEYKWQTAKDMADSLAARELSRIHEEGETEVNGRTFYYYSYSVLEYEKSKTTIRYHFEAFCDLEDGSIYTIAGYTQDYPEALEKTYYQDWMDVTLLSA
ncbi:MAG: hypothetical protein K2N41_07630 [Lachnospiraceae bacterium]|nr:hypothetical protein [Lachnospiraceae bacterium]MDE7239567.1 hypothetical protein [Lachnospiraceae bacterium]